MKILMISSYLPFPLHSGGQTRLYNLIKELSDKHEITLICEKRKNQTEEDIKNVEKICKKVITVERQKQWSLKNICKTAFSSSSFLVTGHTHPKMQELIRQELTKEKFDLIHVETFYVMHNLVSSIKYKVLSIPVVLVEHNIEYQVYRKFMNRAPIFLKPLLAIDIAKIKREEIGAWRRATKVVTVSEEDKKEMEKNGINPAIVSNGVNIDEFSFKQRAILRLRSGQESKEQKVLFIGDFKWLQNRDSVEFIIRDIWPLIRRHSGDERSEDSRIRNERDSGRASLARMTTNLKLWIVGREIPDSIRNLTNDPDIIFDEESSKRSAPEIFQEADILLAPIRVGGGTSYKILESMSCGTPVVTMQMSATAISAKDSQHLMVGKNAEELAEKTIEILENKNLYEKIARNGRKLIEDKYSWKNIAQDLEDVYRKVA